MPNAPSDPAEMARVLVETAHRVLDQAHPVRVTTVRVVRTVTANRVTAQRATENVVRTVSDLKEIVLIAATVRPVTVSVRSARALLAETVPATRRVMVKSVSGSHARVTSVVSGNPVRVATASRLVTAPTVSVPVAMRGSVVPTATVRSAAIALSTVNVRAQMTAASAMSVPN